MNERPAVICNAVEVFDLAVLRARFEPAANSAPVEVLVRHPDREMDGSCRWCGCRQDEVVVFEARR